MCEGCFALRVGPVDLGSISSKKMTDLQQSASQNHQTFRQDGVLSLSQVVGGHEVSALQDHFWDAVERTFAIRRDSPATWTANPYNPAGDDRARMAGAGRVTQWGADRRLHANDGRGAAREPVEVNRWPELT